MSDVYPQRIPLVVLLWIWFSLDVIFLWFVFIFLCLDPDHHYLENEGHIKDITIHLWNGLNDTHTLGIWLLLNSDTSLEVLYPLSLSHSHFVLLWNNGFRSCYWLYLIFLPDLKWTPPTFSAFLFVSSSTSVSLSGFPLAFILSIYTHNHTQTPKHLPLWSGNASLALVLQLFSCTCSWKGSCLSLS